MSCFDEPSKSSASLNLAIVLFFSCNNFPLGKYFFPVNLSNTPILRSPTYISAAKFSAASLKIFLNSPTLPSFAICFNNFSPPFSTIMFPNLGL